MKPYHDNFYIFGRHAQTDKIISERGLVQYDGGLKDEL